MVRAPAASVIEGLETKSDKIRALAHAGYLRTEISRFLNIRYQHVRKVLVDSGIQKGLQRDVEFERPPVSAEIKPRVSTHGDVLVRSGFRFIGEWVAGGGGEIELNAKAPTDAGVYAFLVEDSVVYVGFAQRGFRSRMGHYRRGHQRQRTSARIKRLIAAALAKGEQVKVIIATPDVPLEWNGLPINAAAGLEAGLIRMIQPEWNLLGIHAKKPSV